MKNDSIQAELQLTLNIYPPSATVFVVQLNIYRRRTGEICRGHNSFESSGIYFIVHFWNINLISCRTFYFILYSSTTKQNKCKIFLEDFRNFPNPFAVSVFSNKESF